MRSGVRIERERVSDGPSAPTDMTPFIFRRIRRRIVHRVAELVLVPMAIATKAPLPVAYAIAWRSVSGEVGPGRLRLIAFAPRSAAWGIPVRNLGSRTAADLRAAGDRGNLTPRHDNCSSQKPRQTLTGISLTRYAIPASAISLFRLLADRRRDMRYVTFHVEHRTIPEHEVARADNPSADLKSGFIPNGTEML